MVDYFKNFDSNIPTFKTPKDMAKVGSKLLIAARGTHFFKGRFNSNLSNLLRGE
jgi:hypothetical protein